ncbi:hypothetical protein ACWXVW_17000 [Pantoea dispersa]
MISSLECIQLAIFISRKCENLLITEDIVEKGTHFFLKAKMSRECLSAWNAVYQLNLGWLDFTFKDSTQNSMAPSDADDDEICTINIKVFSLGNYLLSLEGWISFLSSSTQPYNCAEIYILGCDKQFENFSFKVKPWLGDPISRPKDAAKAEYKIRNYVKAQSYKAVIPDSLYPWLLKVQSSNNVFFEAWKVEASKNILISLVNEIDREDESFNVKLSGKPPKHLEFKNKNVGDELFDDLQLIGSWVYSKVDDIEVKHTLFSSELAREWPDNTTLEKGFLSKGRAAFDSAKLLFKAHLRTSSKDTLKSLGDLRKGLVDDVQKMTQQTKDIASSLWKDLAIVMATVVLKYSTDAAKITSLTSAYGFIFLALSVYLFLSFKINNKINNDHILLMDESRITWRRSLYSFMDEDDYKSMAGDVIGKSIGTYHSVSRIIGCIIYITSASLLYLSLHILSFADLISSWIVSLHSAWMVYFDNLLLAIGY